MRGEEQQQSAEDGLCDGLGGFVHVSCPHLHYRLPLTLYPFLRSPRGGCTKSLAKRAAIHPFSGVGGVSGIYAWFQEVGDV